MAETGFSSHDPGGAVATVVAEVHTTYRQRYRYLVAPGRGRPRRNAEAVLAVYPVDGYYRMSVTLHRPGERPFTATVGGARRSATRAAVCAAAIRYPLQTWLIRNLITAHGLALWARGLPVQPRLAEEELIGV